MAGEEQAKEVVRTFKTISAELCREKIEIVASVTDNELKIDVYCHSPEDTRIMIGVGGSVRIAINKILDSKARIINLEKRVALWVYQKKVVVQPELQLA